MENQRPTITPPAKSFRRWFCATLALTVLALCLFAVPTIYIDPLFHYHPPLAQYQYPITDERYQNDGIVRHFPYDGIITGTSMTENFNTSEADALFDAKFVKVPFSGGRYKEISDNLSRAYKSGQQIRYIIRGLDLTLLIMDKDAYYTGYQFPYYLYNNNPFDDVQYLLNKTILFRYSLPVIDYTAQGNLTTSFDEYQNWNDAYTYGASAALSSSEFVVSPPPDVSLTEEDRVTMEDNLQQNVIAIAKEHPETTFYLFFPPYSIAYWGNLYNVGGINRMVDAEQLAIELLLEVPNIRLYSFDTNIGLTCNLDNYKDYEHYGEWINSWILEQMAADNYRLTLDNYQEYLATIRDFYTSYDYVALNDLK